MDRAGARLLACLAAACAVAQLARRGSSADYEPPAQAQETRRTAEAFLAASFMPAGLVLGLSKEPGVAGQASWIVANRTDGGSGYLSVDVQKQRVVAFVAPRPQLVDGAPLGVARARELATALAQTLTPEAARWGARTEVYPHYSGTGLEAGTYPYTIRCSVGDVRLPLGGTLALQAWDGKLAEWRCLTQAVDSWPAPRLLQDAAVAAARGAVPGRAEANLQLLHLSKSVHAVADGGSGRLYYSVLLAPEGALEQPAGGRGPVWAVEVDSVSGQASLAATWSWSSEQCRAASAGQPILGEGEWYAPCDDWPVYLSEQGSPAPALLLEGYRSRPGAPLWYSQVPSIFCYDAASEQIKTLWADRRQPCRRPTAGGGWVAYEFGDNGGIACLRISDGFVQHLSRPRQVWQQPALSPDGRVLLFAGRTLGGNSGVWVAHQTDGGFGGAQRILGLPASACCPVASPDGRTMLYAATLGATTHLMMAQLPEAPGAQAKPTTVTMLPADPTRLSLSPDGRMLLASSVAGLHLVDLARQRTRELRLASAPGTALLCPENGTISPTGHLVTFAATVRQEGVALVRGRFIFTCGLDGGDLRQITPPTDVVARPWQFTARSGASPQRHGSAQERGSM